MRIGLVGAGSLGTIIGGLISKAGHNIDLIDTNEAHVKQLNENGAKITGTLEETIPVNALLPDQLSGEYDLILLLTKQTYTEAALQPILPLLRDDSIVVTLQNGIPEEKVARIVGKERTVGGVVGFGATWAEPGVSELTTELEVVEKYAFDIGELDGKIRDRLYKIKDILEAVGYCEIVDNINGMKWSKLLMNTTFSGMSAALGCTFGKVLNSKDAMRALSNIADETVKVARAHDIKLALMQGKDFEDLELDSQEDIPNKMPFYEEVWGPHALLKASMLQDLEKGIKSEINDINGYLADKGAEKGVPTPFNDLVVKLVQEAEATKEVPDFDVNIVKFNALQV